MDDVYRARLVGSPSKQHIDIDVNASGTRVTEDVTVRPHLHGSPDHEPTGIPIQLPTIYVNPLLPNPPPAPPAPAPPPPPPREPLIIPIQRERFRERFWMSSFRNAHPLTWIAVTISLCALVLGVPKGHFPTLTGRHKDLRAQEKLVADRLALLSQLSTFLPPPLSNLVAPTVEGFPKDWPAGYFTDRQQLELLRNGLGGMRFWNTELGNLFGAGLDGPDRWWSVEDIGRGASVVRSRGEGKDREVWVLRTNAVEGDDANAALVSALTHSLLLRDKLQAEIEHLRTLPAPVCPAPPPIPIQVGNMGVPFGGGPVGGVPMGGMGMVPNFRQMERPVVIEEEDDFSSERRRDEWERLEERKRREREREREVEDRERAVSRREKWVIDEMRKLSDKIHAEASELTLEDKITERLKQYQRQLSSLAAEADQHH